MKQFKVTILLIATCLLLCACPDKDGHEYITIVNQSDKAIIWQPKVMNISEKNELQYACQSVIGGKIDSNSLDRFDYNGRGKPWESVLNSRYYLQIIVMDDETYIKYMGQPCEIIRENVPVLHGYQLTIEDLQKMNWTIVYPPNE